jgi:hypothetical protein
VADLKRSAEMKFPRSTFILSEILAGCVSLPSKKELVGQYINVGYQRPVGYWLHVESNGQYESGVIASSLGGGDRGLWTLAGDRLLLKSQILGESAAQISRRDGKLILHWKEIDYVNTGDRSELFISPRASK